jgi:hypothetical protein
MRVTPVIPSEARAPYPLRRSVLEVGVPHRLKPIRNDKDTNGDYRCMSRRNSQKKPEAKKRTMIATIGKGGRWIQRLMGSQPTDYSDDEWIAV